VRHEHSDNQFKHWFLYVVTVFTVITLLIESVLSPTVKYCALANDSIFLGSTISIKYGDTAHAQYYRHLSDSFVDTFAGSRALQHVHGYVNYFIMI
jgi:hypothetical protein